MSAAGHAKTRPTTTDKPPTDCVRSGFEPTTSVGHKRLAPCLSSDPMARATNDETSRRGQHTQGTRQTRWFCTEKVRRWVVFPINSGFDVRNIPPLGSCIRRKLEDPSKKNIHAMRLPSISPSVINHDTSNPEKVIKTTRCLP